MKPLILILLAAVVVQAQTIADLARRERARQAQLQTTKIFTTEDVKSKGSTETAEARPVENPTPVAPAAAPATPAVPAIDPVQQWAEETGKLRTRVRELDAQETAALLEINAASAQINAPITSQSAKDQAQRTLEASQQKLVTIRAELTRTRSELQEKDLLGPPPKK
jgi:hypothetical protein